MKIDKTKGQKYVTRYMVKPSYAQYLGIKVDKDTDIENEEKAETEHYKSKVQQKIKNLKLITEATISYHIDENRKVKEHNKTEVDLYEGQILIFMPGKGYIVTNQEYQTIDEIQKDFDVAKEIKNNDEELNKQIKE